MAEPLLSAQRPEETQLPERCPGQLAAQQLESPDHRQQVLQLQQLLALSGELLIPARRVQDPVWGPKHDFL